MSRDAYPDRVAADRAEIVAICLWRLGACLSHVNPKTPSDKALAILGADRNEAAGALRRLAEKLDGADLKRALAQIRACRKTHDGTLPARLVEMWAAAWEQWASEINP